jgi:hypothetical protein
MALNGAALLVGAGVQARREAGMIIDDGRGMTAFPTGEPDPALEVHLPQKIVGFLLEALIGQARALWRQDGAMPAKNLVHGRDSRRPHATTLEAMGELAGALCLMGVADRDDGGFTRFRRSGLARMRAPRAVGEFRRIAAPPPSQPFVAGAG